jgi:hypothetical protein
LRWAWNVPGSGELNFALIEHVPLGAIGLAAKHVVVSLKSLVVPESIVMFVTCSGAVPALVTVMVCAALVVPMGWFVKLKPDPL